VFAVLWLRETQSSQALAAQLVAEQSAAAARAKAAVAAPAPGVATGVPASEPALLAAPGAAENGSTVTGSTVTGSAVPGPVAPGAMPPAPIRAGADAGATALPVRDSVQAVPYGEIPASGERLEALRRQLDALLAGGFRGVVTVTSFPGRFCLAGNATEGYAPAGADVAFDKCDLVGNPFDESLAPAQREPLALANLIGAIRQRSGGALEVRLTAGAESVRASAYPAPAPTLKAGEWNRAAEGNNRLEIRIKPAST
jgi:hypothetical protein